MGEQRTHTVQGQIAEQKTHPDHVLENPQKHWTIG